MASPGIGLVRSAHTALGMIGWANVLDWQLKGDGQTDDAAALLSLFDVLLGQIGGGVIVVPPTPDGYELSHDVDVPTGITVLVSNGVTFPSGNLVAAGGSIWNLAETPLTETGAQVIARSAASVTLAPTGNLPSNGTVTTLAESGFTCQGTDIVFNASNQLVVETAGFYVIAATVFTTRAGGATTTGYATLLINGAPGAGADGFAFSGTNEEIASAVAVVFLDAGATVEVGAASFNANVQVTRGTLGIGAF